MCSDNTKSFLQSKSKDDLTSGLTWDQLYSELSKNTPTLLALLQVCTKTRVARPNTKAVVGVCAVILLKHMQAAQDEFVTEHNLIRWSCNKEGNTCITGVVQLSKSMF